MTQGQRVHSRDSLVSNGILFLSLVKCGTLVGSEPAWNTEKRREVTGPSNTICGAWKAQIYCQERQ